MTGHARIEELIAAYALDAVEEGEALATSRDLLDHLVGCSGCRALFQDLRATAGDLALAAPPSPVSPALHQAVMEAIRPPVESPVAARQGRWTRLTGTPSGRPHALVAAATCIVLGLGGLSASLAGRLSQARDGAARGEEALAFVNEPGARLITMTGQADVGRVTLASQPDGRVLLLGSALRLPDERVFEVWLTRGDELVPAATFVPQGGQAVVALRIDPARDTGVAITVERRRVERPSSPPVLQAALPA
ncbi:MAG: anti-sigma factor domain-containing protein [Acidimicrobiia bacterium]